MFSTAWGCSNSSAKLSFAKHPSNFSEFYFTIFEFGFQPFYCVGDGLFRQRAFFQSSSITSRRYFSCSSVNCWRGIADKVCASCVALSLPLRGSGWTSSLSLVALKNARRLVLSLSCKSSGSFSRGVSGCCFQSFGGGDEIYFGRFIAAYKEFLYLSLTEIG